MATPDTAQPVKLTLGGSSGLGRVRVSIEGFFDFSFWLAEELEELVVRGRRPASPRLYARHRPSVDAARRSRAR
ncbi:MAG: hypothetical protein AB7O38_13665 [Pirellulaceae bacterium]